jgi:hypothetical protein
LGCMARSPVPCQLDMSTGMARSPVPYPLDMYGQTRSQPKEGCKVMAMCCALRTCALSCMAAKRSIVAIVKMQPGARPGPSPQLLLQNHCRPADRILFICIRSS